MEAEIVVTGYGGQFKLCGKQLINAQKAFNKRQGRLTPASLLYFKISTKDGESLSGLDLHLKNGDEIIELRLDAQNRFTVPQIKSKKWVLYANRPGKVRSIMPLVLSPGTSELRRRLGDLRLECNVMVSFMSSELPLPAKLVYHAAGGCDGGKFGYVVNTEHAIGSGSVSYESISYPVKVHGNHSCYAPITNKYKKLPNSARVKLRTK